MFSYLFFDKKVTYIHKVEIWRLNVESDDQSATCDFWCDIPRAVIKMKSLMTKWFRAGVSVT